MNLKFYTLLFTFIVSCTTVFAQSPVVTQTDMPGATSGKRLYQFTKAAYNNDFTKTGANQTWDFSNLIDTAMTVEFRYVAASATPYAALYPSANSAYRAYGNSFLYDSNKVVYLNTTATVYQQVGAYTEGAMPDTLYYQNPEALLHLPATYGVNYTQGYVSNDHNNGVVSVLRDTDRVNVDGYGVLKMPNHTFTNAIRVTTKFKSEVFFTGSNQYFYTYQVNFYVPGQVGAVFSYLNFTDSLFTMYPAAQAMYCKSISTGSGIEATEATKAYVFPNPSAGKFMLLVPAELLHQTAVVYTMQGQVVATCKVISEKQELDLSHLKNGNYLLSIGNATQLIIKNE